MTARAAALTLTLLLLGACGSAPAESSRSAASMGTGEPRDEAAHSQRPRTEPAATEASGTLAQVARAYRDAPALTDQVRLEISGNRGTMRDAVAVALGPGSTAKIATQGYEFTSDGKAAYMHRPRIAGKYFTRPLDGDMVRSFKGIARLPVPHTGLREGRTEQDFLDALGLSAAEGVVLLDEADVQIDGKRYIELRLEDRASSSIRALVDPDTMLLASITMMSRFMTIKAEMSPTVHAALPEPIAFDTAGRSRVQSPNQLVVGVGDMAPDFELTTLDGELIRLSDRRGSVVVLDFWGTWCGPCRMSMPLLDQFARWADQSDLPVEVIAVAGERVPGREQQDAIVRRYWTQAGYVMTNVMDYTHAVASQFDVNGVPYTVVVGPDGRILSVKSGFDRNIVAQLQMLTKEALEG